MVRRKWTMTHSEFRALQDEGRVGANLELVETHVLNIPERIREATGDDRFFVCYNPDTDRFEIHYNGKPFFTYEALVPFMELDSRTIEWMLMMRIRNSREIVHAAVAKNEKIGLDAEKVAQDRIHAYAGDIFYYKNNHPSKDLDKALVNHGRMV
jgi:hypothetical protein